MCHHAPLLVPSHQSSIICWSQTRCSEQWKSAALRSDMGRWVGGGGAMVVGVLKHALQHGHGSWSGAKLQSLYGDKLQLIKLQRQA